MNDKARITTKQGPIEEAIPQAEAAIERGDTLGLKTGEIESRCARARIAQLLRDHKKVCRESATMEDWWSCERCVVYPRGPSGEYRDEVEDFWGCVEFYSVGGMI